MDLPKALPSFLDEMRICEGQDRGDPMLKEHSARDEIGAERTDMNLNSVDGALTGGLDGPSICN